MTSYPTQRQKNGFKLQLLRDKCEEYQRNTFHRHFPRDPKQLYHELKKHDNDFQRLLQRRILKQVQYDILLPASGETDSKKFDTTLFTLLLIQVCGYREPPTGWHKEPEAGDRSEIANLIRLKIGRNGIQHNPLAIETKEYQHWFNYLKQPLLDLGCSQAEINNLLASFQYGSLPAVPSYIGRENELDEIKNKISQNIFAVILVGIGGVGKSETARKYWELHQQDYDNNVILMNATSKALLGDSFKIIAEMLGLETIDPTSNKLKSMKAIIKMVHDYFKGEKVLFVFDDCSEDVKTNIVDFISSNHSTIVTSQIRNWGQHFHEIEINPFSPEDGELFLKNNLDQMESQEDQKRLLSNLDHHPLALQHAVAYMKETKINLTKYIELLEKHKIKLLSTKLTINLGMSVSVLGCLDMTLQNIKRKSSDTFGLLNIIAFLDGKFIHKELLKMTFEDDFEFLESLRLLQSFSIIQCHTSITTGKEPIEIVTIHNLNQTAITADQHLNCIVQCSLQIVLNLFLNKYPAVTELSQYHVHFGVEWYFHLLHMLNEPSFTQYTLQTIAENQGIVFNTLLSKIGYEGLTEIWKQIVLLLQMNENNPLLYEAQLHFVCSKKEEITLNPDFHLLPKRVETYRKDFYEIFMKIKVNVTKPYRKSLIDIIRISQRYYKFYNDLCEQKWSLLDLGTYDLDDLMKYAMAQEQLDINRYAGLLNQGNYVEALKYIDFCEKHSRTFFGEDHYMTSLMQNHQGNFFRRLLEFDKAIECYRKVLENPEYRTSMKFCTMMNISDCFYQKKDYELCFAELKCAEHLLPIISKDSKDYLSYQLLKCLCFLNFKRFSEFYYSAGIMLSVFHQRERIMLEVGNTLSICYEWMLTYKKLDDLMTHVRDICNRNRPEGKGFFQIVMNDCLMIYELPTEQPAVQLAEEEVKNFHYITRFRFQLALKLSNDRGRWYYALIILRNLRYYQSKGCDLGNFSNSIVHSTRNCEQMMRNLIRKFYLKNFQSG